MNTEINIMDGVSTEKSANIDPSEGTKADSLVASKPRFRHRILSGWPGRIALSALALTGIVIDQGVNASQSVAQGLSDPKPAQGQNQKTPPHGTIDEDAEAVKFMHRDSPIGPSSPVEIRASESMSTTMALINMTEEELKNDPKDIRGKGYLKDADGNVTVQFRLNGDKSIDRSKVDPVTSQLEAYQSYAQNTPVEYPQAFVLHPDGKVAIQGGSQSLSGQETRLAINFNFDKDGNAFERVPWAFGEGTGVVTDVIFVPRINKWFVTVNSIEKNTSIYVMTVGNSMVTTTIIPTSLQDRVAGGLTMAGYDASRNIQKAYSLGSADIIGGLLEYEINPQTGQSSVRQLFPDAGFLYGLVVENDSNGNTQKVYANSPNQRAFYIFDVVNGTSRAIDTSFRQELASIPGFLDVRFYATRKLNDTFISAGYYFRSGGSAGAIMVTWREGVGENAAPVFLSKQLVASRDGEDNPLTIIHNGLELLKFANVPVALAKINPLGEMAAGIGPEGKFSPERYFPNKKAEQRLTRVYIPAVYKNFGGHW